MEKQDYQFSEDINLPSFADISNSIKTEDFKAEYDDVSLFAQLDNITNNLTASMMDAPMVLPAYIPATREENKNSILQNAVDQEANETGDVQNTPLLSDSLQLYQISHVIKYKLLDGKHVRIWECGLCQKEFTHQYTLMRHFPTHTDERKFQCATCGKAFRQMSTLSQHRAIHSTERPYVCEVCSKTFNRVSTLISHRKTHTGLKPHRCHLCTKAFHQKGNLRNHIFTHTNARPYKCDICEKGFNQMSNLMCHKLKAHQRTEKPKYQCSICDKSFPKRISLRQHEQYTHKIVSPVDSVRTEYPVQKTPDFKDGIIVEPIKTEAMALAVASNQTPFALLRPVTGKPVLVRVLPAGDKQMLVPATAEDLKKHSNISISSKDGQEAQDNDKSAGNTVRIKIPVVATVIIQQSDPTGQLSISVVSPGPSGDMDSQPEILSSNENNFVYSCTLPDTDNSNSTVQSEDEAHKNNVENKLISVNNPSLSEIHKNDSVSFLEEVKMKLEGDQILNELNKILENFIYQNKENKNANSISNGKDTEDSSNDLLGDITDLPSVIKE